MKQQRDPTYINNNARSTAIVARSTIEFPYTVIREVPHSKQVSPIQFLREQEKRLRNLGKSLPIKELTRGMSGRRSLLDAVQLAETLVKEGVRSPQLSVLWGTVKHIRQEPREISFLHSSYRSKVSSNTVSRSGMSVTIRGYHCILGRRGERREHQGDLSAANSPYVIEAPIKNILKASWIEVSLVEEDPGQSTWPA
ncbi:hypothetical protein MKW92_044260 [Papaver armeniacum]|nr:hypothetical protein MKW92_044260 [Papaver armeniacum]